MEKTAQDTATPADLMSLYAAMLRAVYLVHQKSHWEAQKYANHLLFQRIYEGTLEMADEAAEKAIGVFGELTNQEIVGKLANRFDGGSPAENSMMAEKAFQKLAEYIYKALEEMGAKTMGIDDMIMAHCSKSELHVYLLKQA
jgi:DNA-binding ferritin-like protein